MLSTDVSLPLLLNLLLTWISIIICKVDCLFTSLYFINRSLFLSVLIIYQIVLSTTKNPYKCICDGTWIFALKIFFFKAKQLLYFLPLNQSQYFPCMNLSFAAPSPRNTKLTGLVFQSTQNWCSHTRNPFAGHKKINHLSSRKVASEDSRPNRALLFQGRHLIYSALRRTTWGWQCGTDFLAEWITDPLAEGPSAHSPLARHGSGKRIITLRKAPSLHLLLKPCEPV